MCICTRLTIGTVPGNSHTQAISPKTGKLAYPARQLSTILSSVSKRSYPTISTMTSRTSAKSRLNLFSKHLDSKPFLELNTPFSTERTGSIGDAQGNRIPRNTPQVLKKPEPKQLPKKEEPPKMASAQAPHPALMIPGPIEFDDEVLKSMSFYRYRTYPIVLRNMLIHP